MPRIQALTAVGLLAATLLGSAAPAAIPWTNNLGEAQQIARQQQQLLLLHFYADWCSPCRRLDREVFPRPDVAAAIAASYVPVKIDGDKLRDLARQYQVDRFPTDVICDPSGRVVARTVTPGDPQQYIQLLNQVAASHRVANPNFALASREQPAQGYGAAATRRGADEDRWQPPAAQAAPPPAAAGGNYYGAGERPNRDDGPAAAGRPNAYANAAWAAPPARPAPYAPLYADPYSPAAPPSGQDAYRPAPPPAAPLEQQNPYVGGPGAEPAAAPPSLANRSPQWNGPAPLENQPHTAAAAGATVPSLQTTAGAAAPPTADPRLQTPQAPSSGGPPATIMTFGLDGFCPATLVENDAWRAGDPRWGVVHRGRTYLFASEAHQQRFLADPDRYSPVLSGYDPTLFVDHGRAALGKRNHGMWFRGKMYLFSDEASLDRFRQAPEYYAQKSYEVMMRGQLR